jgi:hypothetical protein
VDLRGGGHLLLAPGARSAALREEWLYDNHHVSEWERAGWLRRMPARMAEVGQPEAPPAVEEAAPAAAARTKTRTAAKPRKTAARTPTPRKTARR